MSLILCVAVNIRAIAEKNRQSITHKQLSAEIERLTNGNVLLQEEIKKLKKDPRTIEREARKIGMTRPNEKILVQMN